VKPLTKAQLQRIAKNAGVPQAAGVDFTRGHKVKPVRAAVPKYLAGVLGLSKSK